MQPFLLEWASEQTAPPFRETLEQTSQKTTY